jgi:hypothetical protein
MMTFRKLAAAGAGKLIRAYFTESRPEPPADPSVTAARQAEPGGRLTSYYTGRDSRAAWRPDMPLTIAAALGIKPGHAPQDVELDRLFEARRADTGEAWSSHPRKVSAYDLTIAPHKSVTLAAEFAATPAEGAAIWHAIDQANDDTMRYVARELGWARKGAGGEDGADPGAVGWVSFRHYTARPTVPVRDGAGGATYLADVPMDGDPHAHIHNAMFNAVATEDGRVGSLDTQRLHARVHEFGAYFQARLADRLRGLGARVAYDRDQQAIVLPAIPQAASDLFSKGRRQVLRAARAYARHQGLDWETMSAKSKFRILSVTGLAARLEKHGKLGDREIWRAQAETIGWQHVTVMEGAEHPPLSDAERFDKAYAFAAKQLAAEFRTAAVIDHDRLRLHAARGLIGTGIAGGPDDIDKVVGLIELRGLTIGGEPVALLTGLVDNKVRVTHTAQVRLERDLRQAAHAAAQDRSGALPAAAITGAIQAAIRAGELDFQREPEHAAAQRAAIYALGQGGALSLLTGVAGAGKTTLLKPLVAAWQADTRCDLRGREIIGTATAWRQADALRDTGISRTIAMDPLLASIASGELTPTRNTVLVIDEVSQIAPRAMLTLLEVQARTGMTIKALGDREQVQSIEAGDTIELLIRALPESERPVIGSSVRQTRQEDREIANLFRAGQAADALALKRERGDGSARLLGGDQDQVVAQIADFYLLRRDLLAAAGARTGITVTALANEDAADISRAIRSRMKARGEIGEEETVYRAIDQRGELYDLPIARGDRVRLFRRTYGVVEGKQASFGSNGDVVTVVGRTETGLLLRDKAGRAGSVGWNVLTDKRTRRLLLGFGHVLTVDAAQGITSDEHINALPRGTAGATAFKGYVAESRARGTTWTMISEAATFEAVKHDMALGDTTPISSDDLWGRVARDLSQKPYKPLGSDLLAGLQRDRERAVETLISFDQARQMAEFKGRDPGREIRLRRQAETIRSSLPLHIAALDEALRLQHGTGGPISNAAHHLHGLRVEAELRNREMRQAEARTPGRSTPSPGGLG